jgi:hypothetical protein
MSLTRHLRNLWCVLTGGHDHWQPCSLLLSCRRCGYVTFAPAPWELRRVEDDDAA